MKLRALPNADVSPKTVLHQILELYGDTMKEIVIIVGDGTGKSSIHCSSMSRLDFSWYAMQLLHSALKEAHSQVHDDD